MLSPHLAGMPHDAAASQALRYSITARALIFLARQVGGSEPGLRDALLAQAEAGPGKPPELEGAAEAIQP